MKFIVALLVASLAVVGVLSLPAGSPSDDAEVIDVPRRQVISRHKTDDSNDSSEGGPDFKDFKGVVDTGVGYPFLQPRPLPFSFNLGIFDTFEDIFRRMTDQIWTSGLPSDGDTISSFDPSKGNSTSTVKIVNGHKIEVNETVFGDEDAVFKVRLVNIRPVDSDEDVGETTVSESNAPNPVTSAPNKNREDNESDERRETLEKKPDENEINRNIDEPEHTKPQALAQIELDSMLLVTNENNTANLNATFVTDNSLEVETSNGNIEQSTEDEIAEVVEIGGNIEAETNKTINNSIAKKGEMKSHESSTIIATSEDNTPVEHEDVEDVESQAHTNESYEERNNGPNESSYSDIEVDATTAIDDNNTPPATTTEPESDLRIELTEGNIKELATESIEIDDVTEVAKSVDDSTEWFGDDAIDAPAEIDNNPNERRYSSNREDISSSDDEEVDAATEMHPEFIAEWADFQDNLVKKDDEMNGLSNDINVYDAVPVDLSNDIAVNDLAAANPDFPINPDSEFIAVYDMKKSDVIPKFEKLAISASDK